MGLLDAYSAWKLAGGSLGELPAKHLDAFAALEREMRREASRMRETAA
jgi:hypothetical protein